MFKGWECPRSVEIFHTYMLFLVSEVVLGLKLDILIPDCVLARRFLLIRSARLPFYLANELYLLTNEYATAIISNHMAVMDLSSLLLLTLSWMKIVYSYKFITDCQCPAVCVSSARVSNSFFELRSFARKCFLQ